RANPWRANPWRANPWRANPWRANAEELNVVATGRPPTSSVMPAPFRALPLRPAHPLGQPSNGVVIGVLDSGLAGGWNNTAGYRPALLGTDLDSMQRISGPLDLPSRPMGPHPADNYLDPVAGHGTFIAGIIEQLTPGCEIRVERVFEPEGDVSTFELAVSLWILMGSVRPKIVNFSFGGTGRGILFELLIKLYHELDDVVFVAAAGNEGSCVEQYPAALPSVIGVAGLGPAGPAEWSNYGPWVDACAPGTDLVSSFFAWFDGDLPRINGIDSDDFNEWATWSGTSFAAPVVVAALAREMVTTSCTAVEAVDRVVHAPHLARLVNMGTVVNY
ncbi:MAG TPA: S8/S53 family peptidase, partial [Ilumatobacteraceae bacterium]|nr:S8/S53 family peptidase [Ilumatobacteraceae bacterium]